jgi:hypothetical protein
MGDTNAHKPASLRRFERQDAAVVRLEESRQEVSYFLSLIKTRNQQQEEKHGYRTWKYDEL